MRVYARYDMPSELFKGLTRREWTEQQLGDEIEQPPELEIPDGGEFLWNLFAQASDAVPRQRDGRYYLIAPSEWSAWLALNYQSIGFEEWECLHAMDVQFCTEMNKDVAAMRERERERQQTSNTAPRSRSRR